MPKLERHDSLTGASFRKASRASTDQNGLPKGHSDTNGHASTNGKAQDGQAAHDIEMGNPSSEVWFPLTESLSLPPVRCARAAKQLKEDKLGSWNLSACMSSGTLHSQREFCIAADTARLFNKAELSQRVLAGSWCQC